ncbi:MAG: branched-chain amino acid ABC transporter substrate-binding protein [Rubrivivax sp.]|jgi:ABC transporter substrate binding protein (PQQ-dependent alcohol dehydrogenase system)|nr:branched-chain amino acid ABC transporter substrate-binding protein [Rubrivivax sp.]
MRQAAPLVAAACLALLAAPAMAAAFKVTLLAPADDSRLERARIERGLLGHPGGPAAPALQVALKEAAMELDAAGAALELQVVEVADAAAARAAASASEKQGAAAIVADLPAPWLLAAADAVKAPVLNVGAGADALREADCRRNLWHVVPSERMRADALAQALVARRWTNVLLLTGPLPEDAARSATVQAAIKRYGLKLAGSKPFKLSADPRERDLANPLLLTQGSYDVVWVVDSDGEFAAALPYRTVLPRPVVGDGGLVPVAWSRQFERFGAPQVSRRIARGTQRPTTSHDWTAWLAGKALVAAAVAAPKGPVAAFQQALGKVEVDGSKGVAMSFRPWDGQLRQPILLADGQGVAGIAPADGVLHPRNNLDTLGADQPEKLCKARP